MSNQYSFEEEVTIRRQLKVVAESATMAARQHTRRPVVAVHRLPKATVEPAVVTELASFSL